MDEVEVTQANETATYVSRAFLDQARLATDKKKLHFVAATEGRKRDGLSLSMDPKEWDLGPFRDNPVFLWRHNQSDSHDGTPIGSVDISFEANQMRAAVDFDVEDDFAVKVKGKYERKFLNTVSIRWIPARISESGKNELLEVSAVPIPADPDAVQISARSFKEELESPESQSESSNPERDAGPLNHDQLYDRLSVALKVVYPADPYGSCMAYISMVYDNFVIVFDYKVRRHFKHTYTTSAEGEVTIDSAGVEVLMAWQEVSTMMVRVLQDLTPKQFEDLQKRWHERHYKQEEPGDPTNPTVLAANNQLRASEILANTLRTSHDSNPSRAKKIASEMILAGLGGQKP